MSYELQINAVIARIVKAGGDTDEGARDTIIAEVFSGDAAAAAMFNDYLDAAFDLANRMVA